MNIRRFFGSNSREALGMVRKALGENAVILSNRAVNGGNEIMAFKEEDMQAMVARESDQSHVLGQQNQLRQEQQEPKTLRSLLNQSNRSQPPEVQSNRSQPIDMQASRNAAIAAENTERNVLRAKMAKAAAAAPAVAPAVAPAKPALAAVPTNQQMTAMLNEMRDMRSVIEAQLTTIAWGNIQQRDPIKSKVLSMLLAAGFSATLSRQLAENMPANQDSAQALTWIKAILARNLNTIENETEILDRGGIFALIGPTGVGKTTTTAKLAARYVMKHGTQNLGLITTDAYRIGGHEQLRIYGKILGVMVHAVKDEADLKIALNELKNKHTILIDTVGVSQRDRMVAEQISMLSGSSTSIKKLLCLNATSTGETLADVIRAYKGKGLDGCIITKIDEAATIGNTLDVIVREKIKLYYATNGQRVPEDLHVANKTQLIKHALKLSAGSNKSFHYLNEELPFVMGNTAQANKAVEINYV
jgi:flagellar biosynthesis protein FlhF